jgi:DNA topoisomerase-3
MRTLYIAEKPSVARDLARVLGATKKNLGFIEGPNVVVTWCFGHLAGIAPNPDHYNPAWKTWDLSSLPILPENLEIVASGDLRQLNIISGFLRSKDISDVVNACDAAREGEAIFRNVYEYSKSTKSIRRLWIASMTDNAIRAGLRDLKPGHQYQSLADAARSREEADWLIGINATRALTLKARAKGAESLYSVGRVQTPTLAMIVDRDRSIELFRVQNYWELHGTFSVHREEFLAIYHPVEGPRFDSKSAVMAIHASLSSESTGQVVSLDTKPQRLKPPLLFDLTSLQRAANTAHGFSAQKTLDIAQSLYEKHKLLTYPRTDSSYITKDMESSLLGRVSACQSGEWAPLCDTILAETPPFQARVINDAKVSDHHAILPTEVPVNLASLSKDEAAIYEMVSRRMLASFCVDVEQLHTTAIIDLGGRPFVAKGSQVVQWGWWEAEPPSRNKDAILPTLEKHQKVDRKQLTVVAKQTRPPKRFTEASLLGAMETAGRDLDDEELRESMKERGIGTPATRASIIELLLKRDYIGRDGKSLLAKPLGRELILALPDPSLKSAELTGEWEYDLDRVRRGELSRADFMGNVRQFAKSVTANIKGATIRIDSPAKASLGACPLCKSDVFETPKVFTCQSGSACNFVIFKTVAKRKISPTIVRTLLKDGRTKPMKGFTSNAGKKFETALEILADGRIGFYFAG